MVSGQADFPVTPAGPGGMPAGYTPPAGQPSGGKEPPKTPAEILLLRNNFLEMSLRRFAEAVNGIFVFGSSAFDQVRDWAVNLGEAAWGALEKIAALISRVGGNVIEDVGDAINDTVQTLSGLMNKLLHNAGEVIGNIPQHLVTGLTGALGAINNAIGAARDFVQNVIDAIVGAIRGIPIIGAHLPDLSRSVKQQKADQQNFTISAIISDSRNPQWVCRYAISDVTYPEAWNNRVQAFGVTGAASAGTAHTHPIDGNSAYAQPSGWSNNQHQSLGSYLTIANTTVHDTVGLIVWKDAGTLNNTYLEIFKEASDGSLTRVYSQEFSSLITTITQYLEFTLPSRLVVASGERFMVRVRNSSSVATTVRIMGVEQSSVAPDYGFETSGASLTAQTSYTPAEAATARANGAILGWFMLAAKSMPSIDRSYSDDANRSAIGGMWVRQSTTASLLDVYEEAFGYTGVDDGDQSAFYIHRCSRDVNKTEANLYVNPLSTARLGIMLHCSRDLSQVVYLGVDETSSKIYSGPIDSLVERASLAVGGTGKWGLYYDSAADKYVTLKDGKVVGLEWTAPTTIHGADYRFGGIRISSSGGESAGTIDDWNLRDWYVAVPATIGASRMEATATMPDAAVTANVAAVATRMTATAAMPNPSLVVGLNIESTAMGASAEMRSPEVVDGSFTPTTQSFTTPGSHSFVVPSGVRFIDRIALAGGRGGRDYLWASTYNGGEAGEFAWDTLEVGVDFNIGDTINITVGAGGSGGGGAGGNTTIEVSANILTAIGGDVYVPGENGAAVSTGNANGNKDVLLNGQTYAGGNTTFKANRDNPEPGAGGRGSANFGDPGRAGGRGRAWLYLYA